jgi:HIRAN domain
VDAATIFGIAAFTAFLFVLLWALGSGTTAPIATAVVSAREEHEPTRDEQFAVEEASILKHPELWDRHFYTKIVGVSYPNPDGTDRQIIIERCHQYEGLLLCRQPENPHDENAIAVFRETGEQLGYLRCELAEHLAPEMDSGRIWDGIISDITGGGPHWHTHGVNMIALQRVVRAETGVKIISLERDGTKAHAKLRCPYCDAEPEADGEADDTPVKCPKCGADLGTLGGMKATVEDAARRDLAKWEPDYLPEAGWIPATHAARGGAA